MGTNAWAANTTLRLSTGEFPDKIDPQMDSSSLVQFWSSHILEGLVRWNAQGKPELGMAARYNLSEDRKTHTFFIKKSAKWSDGSRVFCIDFLDSFLAIESAKEASENFELIKETGLKSTADVKCAGSKDLGDNAIEEHITFVLHKPVPYFFQMLAMPAFAPRKKGKHNGPFFVSKEDKGRSLELSKNQHYWDAKNVHLETILMPSGSPEELTSVRLLQSNSLDLVWGISAAAQQIALKIPDTKVQPFRSGAVWYLIFNQNPNHLTSSLTFRKLIKEQTNPSEIVYKIMDMSSAKVLEDLVPESYWTKSKVNFKEKKQSLDRKIEPQNTLPSAKSVTLDLLTADSSAGLKLGQYLQAQWKNLGNLKVNVNVNAAMSSIRLQKTKKGEFDIALANIVPWYPDPLAFLSEFSTNLSVEGRITRNSAFDALLNEAGLQADLQKREDKLFQASQELVSQVALIPLYESGNILVSKKGLQGIGGVRFGPNPDFRFAKWETKD